MESETYTNQYPLCTEHVHQCAKEWTYGVILLEFEAFDRNSNEFTDQSCLISSLKIRKKDFKDFDMDHLNDEGGQDPGRNK